jgi:hypothetical protein
LETSTAAPARTSSARVKEDFVNLQKMGLR